MLLNYSSKINSTAHIVNTVVTEYSKKATEKQQQIKQKYQNKNM